MSSNRLKQNKQINNKKRVIKKDDIISIESRIIIRTTKCRMNEKITKGKKMKACNNEPIQIKMEKGNNLESIVYCIIRVYYINK